MNKIFTKAKISLTSLLLVSTLAFPFSNVFAIDEPIAPVAPIAPTIVAPTPPIAPITPTDPTAPKAPTAPTSPTDPTVSVDPAPTNGPAVNVQNPTSSTSGGGSHSGSRAVNSGNGADSTNNSSSTTTNDTGIVNVNDATVTNNQNVDVTTGDNNANKNMGDASVTSGNASVSGGLMTDINNNTVTIGDLCGMGCSAGFVDSNLKNGSGTLNNADGSLTNLVLVNNSNNLNLTNNSNLSATTGYNQASKNMGGGTIVSGDANVAFTTVNLGNNNGINATTADYNIVDNQSADLWINFPTGTASGAGLGSLGASNIGNGADSTNTSTANSSNSTVINNNNNLTLNNDITLYANTGNNTADKNMGSGNITTGNANIASNVINFLNNNIVAGANWLISTVNIFGNMTGNIILPRLADGTGCGCAADLTAANTGNGSGSTDNANTTVTDTTNINNANTATVSNNLSLNSNTGGNSTDKNMGNSSISTGNTSVDSNLVTVANTNAIGQGDTWWLVIINNHGTYTGQIMGAGQGDMIAGSGLQFGVNPDGSIEALNSGNGAGSNNNAATTTNNSTTINNTNTAAINNNININANTGNNTADKNMGGGNIQTGNVNVVSNIVNFINNNFVGKKFVVTLVNIFGSFSGKIIPPNQPLPTVSGIGSANIPVDLASSTTLSVTSATTNKAPKTLGLSSISSAAGGSLSQALQEGGKLLENAASTQNKVNDTVKKVINQGSQKSSFQFNFVLLGVALLVLAAYAFVARRRAS